MLTSCLIGLDSTKQVNMLLIQRKQSSWIQTKQTGGHLHSDISPYEVSECSLVTGKVQIPREQLFVIHALIKIEF